MAIFKVSAEDKHKEDWCETLFGKKVRFPREFTEAQLRRLTTDLLMQHDRIIRESAEIIRDTEDENTRYSRIDLMRICSDEQQLVIEEARKIVESIL